MECTELLKICQNNVCDRTVRRIIRKRVKLIRRAVYAGLIVCFVPSILCDPDWSRHLTFDQIYNNTNYVQLQHSARPYDLPEYSFRNIEYSHEYNSEEEYQGNELGYGEYGNSFRVKDSFVNKEPLLVGFAHDPFRYSVPEDDYLKGVRNMNPKSIMSKGENRGKRGVLHLYNMMYCATGCEPLAYKGYGCYCGFLGSGRPTDGIDRCCKMHDECYENIYCPFYTVYFQPYYWKCYRGQPLCARENYHTQHNFINGCAARLCECDRRFAMCVRRYSCPRKRALCRSSPIRLLQNLLMYK